MTTPRDLRLARAALSQEINTLRRLLDPRCPAREDRRPRADLEARIEQLLQLHRQLVRPAAAR
ncbi:MAG: hypothetical protein ABII82_00930 [Verrucomicrobiota bacterium]